MPLPLSSSEISILEAGKSEPIRSLPAQTLVSKIGNVIKEICLVTGLKVEEEYSKEFTKTVVIFLRAYYSYLTPSEITTAFHLNAAGELPTKTVIYGSNLTINYIGWVLSGFKDLRSKLADKIKGMRHPELPEPEPTPEEIDDQERRFCNDYYQKWLSRDFSPVTLQYAHMVYDSLDRMSIIQLSVNQKQEYFSQAQAIRKSEIEAPTVDWSERKLRNRLIQDYLNDAVPHDEKELVKNYAKRLALLDYFKSCKEKGTQSLFDEKDMSKV